MAFNQEIDYEIEDEAPPLVALSLDECLHLGQTNPELLLGWVYESLGYVDSELDQDWVGALHRGALNSTLTQTDPEFAFAMQLKWYPVSMSKFLFDREYMGKAREDIYPEVERELCAINNPDGTRIVNKYVELVATGGIGSAKSTTALYTVAYQLYVLSCFENPHAAFNLDPSSEIVFIFQSLSGQAAKEVDYERFFAMVTKSPYFIARFPFNKKKTLTLEFPHRIYVKPMSMDTGAIGQNVIGGLIDELNFMAIIQDSRRSIDGGEYNQALTIYNGISRRRRSRFLAGGKSPGILCLVSSKRYPGEFTDVKIAEAKNDPSIYVYDKNIWQIKPTGTYSDKRFRVFAGDASRKACIVVAGMQYAAEDEHLLIQVPLEFLKDFQNDLIGSLRDIAGVSTLARYPYFHNRNAVADSFGKVRSILNVEETDFETIPVEFYPGRFRNKHLKRWIHIDLGVVSDSAGVSCGYVPEFIEEGEGAGPMPVIEFDFVLRVKPPRDGEVQFSRIRKLIMDLRQHGLPIHFVSLDSFQSVDTIQILRQQGFSTGLLSMDKTTNPYETTKTAMYSHRVRAPKHTMALKEFGSLEKDSKTGKVDHPYAGSKDCSDSMAGVIHNLSTRREVWADHRVPMNHQMAKQKEANVKEQYQHDGTDWSVLRPAPKYVPPKTTEEQRAIDKSGAPRLTPRTPS